MNLPVMLSEFLSLITNKKIQKLGNCC